MPSFVEFNQKKKKKYNQNAEEDIYWSVLVIVF